MTEKKFKDHAARRGRRVESLLSLSTWIREVAGKDPRSRGTNVNGDGITRLATLFS